MTINHRDLDNHITGHFGEDQMKDVEIPEAPHIVMRKMPFLGRAEYDIDTGLSQNHIRLWRDVNGRWTAILDHEDLKLVAMSPIHALAQALEQLDANIGSD